MAQIVYSMRQRTVSYTR